MPPKPPGVAALAAKFGGGSMCVVCGKSCYANEQVKHNEKVYHEVCFCCKACSMRIAAVGQAAEYQGQMYHKACVSKVLKPPLSPSPRYSASQDHLHEHTPIPRSPSSHDRSPPPSRPPPSPPGLDLRKEGGIAPPPLGNTSLSTTPRSPSVSSRTLEFSLRSNANAEDPRVKDLQAKLAEAESLLEKERAKTRNLEGLLQARSASPQPASVNDSRNGEIETLKAANAQMHASLEARTEQVKSTQAESEKLRGQVQTLTEQLEKLRSDHSQQLETLKNDLKAKSLELDKKQVESDKKTSEMGALSSELQQRTAKLEKMTTENQVLQEDLKFFEAEITSLTEQNHSLQQQYDHLHHQHLQLQQQGKPEPKQEHHQATIEVDSKLLSELTRGHSFTCYRVDSEHPAAQAIKETVFVFYEPNGAPDGHKGWVCWSETGDRHMSLENRIAVNPYTQLATKNGRSVFRASHAQPQCCFSVLGADEDNALDLEAESEQLATRWIEGLRFLLKSSRSEIAALLGSDPLEHEATLEQKQRIEELQKLELDLMQEVEQLKVRKQALLEAEPIDDSDTY